MGARMPFVDPRVAPPVGDLVAATVMSGRSVAPVLLASANGPGGLDLDCGGLAAALAALAALGLLYGRLALAVGAAYPSKLLALAISAGWATRAPTSSAACTISRAGLTRCACSRRSGWLVGQSPLQNGVDGLGQVIRRRSRDLGGGISARRAPRPRRA
jgi:hypothetical protein